jgi:hypothetical protein
MNPEYPVLPPSTDDDDDDDDTTHDNDQDLIIGKSNGTAAQTGDESEGCAAGWNISGQ